MNDDEAQEQRSMQWALGAATVGYVSMGILLWLTGGAIAISWGPGLFLATGMAAGIWLSQKMRRRRKQ